MSTRVDVVMYPYNLRFSAQNGRIAYHHGSAPALQLDGMDVLFKIDPASTPRGDRNLGSLPVASTVLIRGDRTIVVDPGNFHVGYYGLLKAQLARLGVEPSDVDTVIVTHCHHDHMHNTFMFPNKELIFGVGELDYARKIYWPGFVDALTTSVTSNLREVDGHNEPVSISDGVSVIATPGQTPGHISVLVDAGDAERVAILGDVAMTCDEYEKREFSMWYGQKELDLLNASLDRIQAWGPTLVIPGHDEPFRPQG